MAEDRGGMVELLALIPSVASLLALVAVTVIEYRRSGHGVLLQIPIAIYVWPFLFALVYLPAIYFFDSSREVMALGTVLFSVAGGAVIVRAVIGLERAMR